MMRVLYFDRSGFCVWAKRLHAGRFISDWTQVRTREMDWTALKLLLEGIEPDACASVSGNASCAEVRASIGARARLCVCRVPLRRTHQTLLRSSA
jgi:hypothetical protein